MRQVAGFLRQLCDDVSGLSNFRDKHVWCSIDGDVMDGTCKLQKLDKMIFDHLDLHELFANKKGYVMTAHVLSSFLICQLYALKSFIESTPCVS